jgi:phosphoglycerate kinase
VDNPARPFVAIIGGAKVSSKIAVLESLLTKVDRLIVGGGMAYTFLKAKGLAIGTSLVEEDMIDTARQILQKAYESHIYLYLPIDHIVTTEFSPNAEAKHVARGNIEENQMGMDIGPMTIGKFMGALKGARTVFWNGPVGVFEFPKFATGTMAIAKAISELPDCITVIGGGTRSPRSTNPASLQKSLIFPQAAAHRLSSWKAKCCPVWPRFSINKRKSGYHEKKTFDRWKLEDVQNGLRSRHARPNT